MADPQRDKFEQINGESASGDRRAPAAFERDPNDVIERLRSAQRPPQTRSARYIRHVVDLFLQGTLCGFGALLNLGLVVTVVADASARLDVIHQAAELGLAAMIAMGVLFFAGLAVDGRRLPDLPAFASGLAMGGVLAVWSGVTLQLLPLATLTVVSVGASVADPLMLVLVVLALGICGALVVFARSDSETRVPFTGLVPGALLWLAVMLTGALIVMRGASSPWLAVLWIVVAVPAALLFGSALGRRRDARDGGASAVPGYPRLGQRLDDDGVPLTPEQMAQFPKLLASVERLKREKPAELRQPGLEDDVARYAIQVTAAIPGASEAVKENPLVAGALTLAATAHRGQRDKVGWPYIGHAVRVMEHTSRELGTRPSSREGKEFYDSAIAAALLHDVVEDCGVALADLRSSFGERVARAVDGLSHRSGEPYFAYIARCAKDPIANLVKRMDIKDNSDPARQFRGHESALTDRYPKALAILAAAQANFAESE